MKCAFCGTTINPAQDYRKVTGYERQRTAGGTNALRLREPHDVWACRWCVDQQRRGVPAGQVSLLDQRTLDEGQMEAGLWPRKSAQ